MVSLPFSVEHWASAFIKSHCHADATYTDDRGLGRYAGRRLARGEHGLLIITVYHTVRGKSDWPSEAVALRKL